MRNYIYSYYLLLCHSINSQQVTQAILLGLLYIQFSHMSTIRQLFVFLSLATSLLLAACQDHRIVVNASRYRIRQYVETAGRSTYTFNYQYGSDGKLTTIAATGTGGTYNEVFQYNPQGQLERVTKQPGIGTNDNSYRTYTYDGSGRLSGFNVYRLFSGTTNYDLYSTTTLTYGANSQPAVITTTVTPGASTSSTTSYSYSYTGDNGTQVTITPSTGQPIVSTYQFDSTPNPFYGLVGLSEGYEQSAISRNNIVGPNRSVTYDSNGLISGLVIGTNQDPAFRTNRSYSYETY